MTKSKPHRGARNRQNIAAVILCGGGGTRLWPLSTSEHPKQFLRLFGGKSLLRRTYERVAAMFGPQRVFVLTNRQYIKLAAAELPELPTGNVIGEPFARDTAAAVALATVVLRERFDDPVCAVLPADHLIEPAAALRAALESACTAAATEDTLFTFGLTPTYPATGYGYLEAGAPFGAGGGVEHYALKRFKEKPDRLTAARFLKAGNYFWNSGMFVWRAGVIWREIETHLPAHAAALAPLGGGRHDARWNKKLAAAFEPLPRVSIDYGVMEKTANVRIVRGAFQWIDVGGWTALREFLESDTADNARRGRLHALDSAGNIVYCENADEVVALAGVRDLVIVRSGDRTLVAHRERVDDVKQIVAALETGKGNKPRR